MSYALSYAVPPVVPQAPTTPGIFAPPQALAQHQAGVAGSDGASSGEPGRGREALRQAGGEARFRVIPRFGESSAAALVAHQPNPLRASATFAPILEAVEAQNWSQAHSLFAGATGEDELTRAPEQVFLAAYVAHKAGHHAHAQALFESIADRLDALSDYVHHYAALSAHAAGHYHDAALHAASVGAESLLYPASLVQLATSLEAAGTPSDRSRAIEIRSLYVKLYPRRSDAADVQLGLARLLEADGQHDAAARRYLEIYNLHPLSPTARAARTRLDELRPNLSEGVRAAIDAPSLEREMRRFRALFDLHRSEPLVDELSKTIEGWKPGSPERCEGLYLIGRSLTKLRKHADSVTWYERVLTECKGGDFELRALYSGGRGLWNINENARARALFERIWKEYPDHSYADDAMFFSARSLREDGKPEEARKLLVEQVRRYPTGDMAKDAHWLIVRELFEKNDHQGVVAYVDALAQTGEDDLYTRGRLHYFRARARELAGEQDAAAGSYAEVITAYPKTYYALLAFNRLAAIGRDGAALSAVTDLCKLELEVCKQVVRPSEQPRAIEIPAALRQEAAFRKGLVLLSLGLTELARSEFTALRSRHASDPDTLWALAFLLDSAQAYTLSHDIPRRAIDNWIVDYPSDATRKRWEVAFPTPYRPWVTQWAAERNIPVELVYAIMREESGFNARIESWANARGLLQLMEGTAQNVARSDAFGPLNTAQLFDPQINIRLGTAYMAELAGQLQRHPALVIAGYNGGYGNVSRWLGERGELPLDLWVEDIPFGQTRDYTKRVLTSYWTYAFLYGEDRVPRLGFGLK